jgi:large-conductance mechanosensitive channel
MSTDQNNNVKLNSSSMNMQTIKTSFLELQTKLRTFSSNVSQKNIILGFLSFIVFGILIFLCVYVVNSHKKYKEGQQEFSEALEVIQNTIQNLQNRQQQLYNTFMMTPQTDENS